MFPFPTGLGQVLETYAWIRKGMSMGRAFSAVATNRLVMPSTIRSACTRNLSLTAAEFEDLVAPDNKTDFRNFLVSRHPLLAGPIDEFLDSLPEAPVNVSRSKNIAKKKTILQNHTGSLVAEKLNSWSENTDIPAEIRREMAELAESICPKTLE